MYVRIATFEGGDDRESNRGVNLIFCETEDDVRRADAALNEMTPASGRGARSSVEMYELAFDERPGGVAAAIA